VNFGSEDPAVGAAPGGRSVRSSRAAKPAICSYENSPYRTAFWPGREYEDQAERIALRHMLPERGARLCDIGAGFGRLADEYHGYEQVILLDYSWSMLRDAVRRLHRDPRFVFVAADLYNLPFADSALDTAVTVRVLHHVVDVPRAFAEVNRVVSPQGAYITEFANKRHLKARVRRWWTGRPPDLDSLEPSEYLKLHFDFHPRFITEQLRVGGFDVRDKRAVSDFRLAALKRVFPARLLSGLDGLLQRPLAGLDLTPSIFMRSQSAKPGEPVINQALWRCLRCGSTEFETSSEALTCRACSRTYPILEGVIDFRESRQTGT